MNEDELAERRESIVALVDKWVAELRVHACTDCKPLWDVEKASKRVSDAMKSVEAEEFLCRAFRGARQPEPPSQPAFASWEEFIDSVRSKQ